MSKKNILSIIIKYVIIFKGTSLDLLLKEFISGDISHLAMIKNSDGFTIGLVTLEDIIEEILKREIVDETDDKIDNVSKKKNRKNVKRLEKIKKRKELQEMFDRNPPKIEISPSLITAIFQYLRTSVEPFKVGKNLNVEKKIFFSKSQHTFLDVLKIVLSQ